MATLKLVYIHNGKPLMGEGQVDEIDEQMMTTRIKQIKEYYTPYVPDLLNATWAIDPVKEGEQGQPMKVVFNKQVGTKGNADFISQMLATIDSLPAFTPQVVALAHQLAQCQEITATLQLIEVGKQIKTAFQEAEEIVGVISRMEKNLCQLTATPLTRPPLGF